MHLLPFYGAGWPRRRRRLSQKIEIQQYWTYLRAAEQGKLMALFDFGLNQQLLRINFL